MADKGATCRHCGRPIAAPASRCPWPGYNRTIVAVCAYCKHYTDDQGEVCHNCGEPLGLI